MVEDSRIVRNERPLRLAGIGCGNRTLTYLRLASRMPRHYTVTGAADPVIERVERVREQCGNPEDFRGFLSDRELLAQEKFADVVVIGTQDFDHLRACREAMERGYDVLLEKPIATNLEDVLRIEQRARELGRKVMVCHVLRYTPFYCKVKEIVASGAIGEIVSLNATEGVGTWHQAHSYVRGHWAVVEESSPMLISKSCHDLDIIAWLMERPCTRISSFGGLSYFREDSAPEGAPPRCTDGCPVESACPYSALRYIDRHRFWLRHVYDNEPNASDEEILEWLAHSPWGRCVYRCENTAMDHQVVAMTFKGDATATFTMTAFEDGRSIEIFGTRGTLRGGSAVRNHAGVDIQIRIHATGQVVPFEIPYEEDEYHHGGGDIGLIKALHHEMKKDSAEDMTTLLAASVHSHVMGFAAEKSRLTGLIVEIEDFLSKGT